MWHGTVYYHDSKTGQTVRQTGELTMKLSSETHDCTRSDGLGWGGILLIVVGAGVVLGLVSYAVYRCKRRN